MRTRERACAAAETHSSLLLLRHCHAARVRLVQQAHDAFVLACGSLFLLRSNRRRRSDANGSRSRAAWRWRACAGRLTWFGLSTTLARARSSSSSSSSSGCTISRVRLLLALRCAGAAWSVRSMVLHAAEPPAALLTALLSIRVPARAGAKWRQRGTCTAACTVHVSTH